MNRDLLSFAYQVIGGIPSDRFNLAQVMWPTARTGYVPVTECGSIGCGIGWLSMHPKFQELGLKFTPDGGLVYRGSPADYRNAAAEIFDISLQDAGRLFGPRWHEESTGFLRDKTDQEIWLLRASELFHGRSVSLKGSNHRFAA